MAGISLEPYLFFKGNCREAMEFYKSVFGGELQMSTVGESPEVPGMPNLNKDWIMHASLKGDVNLMASDTQKASDKMAKVELSLGGTDEDKMRKIFDGLSTDGTVRMPLEKQFWGDVYGAVTDKFGVEWNMNIGDMGASQDNA